MRLFPHPIHPLFHAFAAHTHMLPVARLFHIFLSLALGVRSAPAVRPKGMARTPGTGKKRWRITRRTMPPEMAAMGYRILGTRMAPASARRAAMAAMTTRIGTRCAMVDEQRMRATRAIRTATSVFGLMLKSRRSETLKCVRRGYAYHEFGAVFRARTTPQPSGFSLPQTRTLQRHGGKDHRRASAHTISGEDNWSLHPVGELTAR
jgi:hypothetical protein